MSEAAIKVNDLSKKYTLHHRQAGTLRDTLALAWKKGLQALSPGETFWALRDVSFEVPQGQVLGIIGRNGAGKSTLLKILSRITPPTKGRVEINGRVASLLEVGTGFHPELTGRENIFLNGAILGMSRAEIRRKFDEIVGFSGVEHFLDTPVKHYSSGMYVRLAFSVAAHLEAEILLLDEVLAVGDAEFQRKCLGKIEKQRTAIIVSHNLGLIQSFCNKGLYIDQGRILSRGNPKEVIDAYMASTKDHKGLTAFTGPLCKLVQLEKVLANGRDVAAGPVALSPFESIRIELFLDVALSKPFKVTFSMFKDGVRVFSVHDLSDFKSSRGRIVSRYIIPPKTLRPGHYTIAAGGHANNDLGDWFWQENITSLEIMEAWAEGYSKMDIGIININIKSDRVEL